MIIDATEQPIEQLKRNKRYIYSGKKKCHILKTEICINKKDRIVNISKSLPSLIHDFANFKQESAPPMNVQPGYQDMHKLHQHVHDPYQSGKHKFSTRWEKSTIQLGCIFVL